MQEQQKSFRDRIPGKLRAVVLAVAAYLLGWGLPAMGVSSLAIPWIVAIGFVLATIAILTDDLVSDLFKRTNCPHWARIMLIILICIAVAGISFWLSNSSVTGLNNSQPTLTIDKYPADILLSDNETSKTRDADIVFHITNIGNKTAYNIRNQMCAIDKDALRTGTLNIKPQKCSTGFVNPIQPQQGIAWQITLRQPYNSDNGDRVLNTKKWFIYCQLSCQDERDGGQTYYFPDFWYCYDITDPNKLLLLTPEEKEQFLPFVKIVFPK